MRVRYLLFWTALWCCVISLAAVAAAGAKSNFYASELFDGVEPGDRVAILMVHFGTSHGDTRGKSIEALNATVRTRYPDIEVREAWSSRIVIGIMARRGEVIPTPREALRQLQKDGYTHVIIQSSNVIEGVEMEALRREALDARADFKDLRVGNPLLYTTEDYRVVVDCLRAKQPRGAALVLVGHGTYTPATAQYAMVDFVMRDRGYDAMYIGTVEGYPDYEATLSRLRSGRRVRKVVLMPFMFVAGTHAKSDIDGDWRAAFEAEGYSVEVLMEGLGEMEQVRELLLEHIDFAMKNQMHDIIEKKEGYAAQNQQKAQQKVQQKAQ